MAVALAATAAPHPTTHTTLLASPALLSACESAGRRAAETIPVKPRAAAGQDRSNNQPVVTHTRLARSKPPRRRQRTASTQDADTAAQVVARRSIIAHVEAAVTRAAVLVEVIATAASSKHRTMSTKPIAAARVSPTRTPNSSPRARTHPPSARHTCGCRLAPGRRLPGRHGGARWPRV